MTGWLSLPLRIKFYISIVVLTAIPFFCSSIYRVASAPFENYEWLVLCALTLITVPVFVLLPSVRAGVTIGDAFVMSICMMFSIDKAIVANVLYISFLTLLLRRRHNTPIHRIVFNIATAVINVQIYGWVYYSLREIDSIILPTFGLAVAFYLSNSIFIATAISLSTEERLPAVWRKNYAPMALEFLGSACTAALIVFFIPLLLPPNNPYKGVVGPILVAPAIALFWGYNKVKRAKVLEIEDLYLRTIETLALAVDAKDQTTYGHIRRVRAYALGLARFSGLKSASDIKAIEIGSLLHDIGKLAVEDYILNKPGRLTKSEFEKMKLHSTAGDEILQQVQFPYPAAQCVRHHHERWDGSGYPDSLRGDEIPLSARILAIADAYDAIRSSRPYKSSINVQDSIELLKSQSGLSYDPKLIQIFIQHISDLENEADAAVNNISELSFRKYFEKIDATIELPLLSPAEATLPNPVLHELAKLLEFCSGIGQTLELEEALPILANRIHRIVPYYTCILFSYQENDSIKGIYVAGNFSQLLNNLTIPLGKGVSGWVTAYKKPMLNADPQLEFQTFAEDFTQLRDILSVPILLDDHSLGAISLYSDSKAFYSQSHLSLLQTIADSAAFLFHDSTTSSEQPPTTSLDPVTQLHSFSYFLAAGAQILNLSKLSNSPATLLYLELTNFFQNISLFGPQISDLILSKVSDRLRSELRDTDIGARYGYNAFVCLLPGVKSTQAVRYAQALETQIRTLSLPVSSAHNARVAFKLGIASYPNSGHSILSLVQSAHHASNTSSTFKDPPLERNVLEFPPRSY